MQLRYSVNNIIQWFKTEPRLGITAIVNDEIKTNCPFCSRPNFYFNARKRVGICHHAKCGKTTNLKELKEFLSSTPIESETTDSSPLSDFMTETDEIPLLFPAVIEVDIKSDINSVKINNDLAYDYLYSRGLTNASMIRFDIRASDRRVYVPVKNAEGKIVQFNSRLYKGTGQKYKYAKGRKVTDFLLGWEECRGWNELTLVENTFVAIVLRDKVHCTTNFGSHLSKEQCKLIAHSRIRNVAVLWDQGADVRSLKAVRDLRSWGILAAYGAIVGQPDDHDPEQVVRWVAEIREAASKGIDRIDCR